MTSRERILAAVGRQTVDHLPCVLHFWRSPDVEGYRWSDEDGRLETLAHRLGVDALIHVNAPKGQHPDVSSRCWRETRPGEKYPIIHRVIETPSGPLSVAVRETDDWPFGLHVPLFEDFNVSRFVKPWLETEQDVERFAWVHQPPGDSEVRAAAQTWAVLRERRERFQVAIMGTYTLGLTGAIHLFGAESGVLTAVDWPEVMERYLDVVHRTDRRALEVMLDLGVDIVRRNGWYESTDFWSPVQFRRFVMPRMKDELALARQAGRPFNYTMCTGIMPLLDDLMQMDFQSLDTIEPVLGRQDMPRLAATLGRTRCLWGGVSAPMHVGEGTPEQVRAAVRQAVAIFGRIGFVLTAVPSVRIHWPWQNVMALVDEWRQVR